MEDVKTDTFLWLFVKALASMEAFFVVGKLIHIGQITISLILVFLDKVMSYLVVGILEDWSCWSLLYKQEFF